MWDDGLSSRFCSECFDFVVDAENLLQAYGLVPSPIGVYPDWRLK
jgi:hypothetical protein